LNRDRPTLKCYLADTGILVSHAFDENGLVSEGIYKKLLMGKLEVNKGMLIENIVAQMLVAAGHQLYFYSNASREDNESRMEIDFLVAKSKVSSRHNISPIEVKSGKNYTLSSITKFQKKYHEQLHTPYVLHTGDYKNERGVVYLPVYMTPLL
jgi:predicted AAA+ superfamily ATPase